MCDVEVRAESKTTCCLVDCTSIHPRTRRLFLLHAGRVLLSVHFLAELVDKLQHFGSWTDEVRAQGLPLPAVEMGIVVLLLLVGAPLLLLGRHVPQAAAFLLLFQVPTTVFFEDSAYERLDSLSVCGGLLLTAYLYIEEGVSGKLCQKTPSLMRQPLLAGDASVMDEVETDLEEGSGMFVTKDHVLAGSRATQNLEQGRVRLAHSGSDAARLASPNGSFATEQGQSESECDEL